MGPDLIRDTSKKVDLIRKRLLTAQSWQKSYTDTRRRPLEFEVGDHVFLKVDSCHGRVSGINKICFIYSSYCHSQATAA